MPKRTFRATGIAFLAFVFALGAIGVVNGLWTGTLVVNGVVTTGDLNADWTAVTTNDAGSTVDPCTPSLNPSHCTPAPTSNIGSCEYVSGANSGTQTAVVQINNVYPNYECTVTGQIGNTGSVPFGVMSAYMLFTGCSTGSPVVCNTDGLDQLGACTLPPNPQVDPASTGGVACTVHVKSTAVINWTYYFAIQACVAQWNEDPSTSSVPTAAQADYDACRTSPQREGPTLPPPVPPPVHSP